MLGIVDLAGADVADAAYPALAVAISGVMLLVGAFFGRAGGLILVGLRVDGRPGRRHRRRRVGRHHRARDAGRGAVTSRSGYDISSGRARSST